MDSKITFTHNEDDWDALAKLMQVLCNLKFKWKMQIIFRQDHTMPVALRKPDRFTWKLDES